MAPLKKVRQAKRDNMMFLLDKVDILPFRFSSLKQHAWTRMHSSRMRTTRSLTTSCSICWCLPGERGACVSRGQACVPRGHVCPEGACMPRLPPLVERILDTRLWKHYLPATTLAFGNEWLPTGPRRISDGDGYTVSFSTEFWQHFNIIYLLPIRLWNVLLCSSMYWL